MFTFSRCRCSNTKRDWSSSPSTPANAQCPPRRAAATRAVAVNTAAMPFAPLDADFAVGGRISIDVKQFVHCCATEAENVKLGGHLISQSVSSSDTRYWSSYRRRFSDVSQDESPLLPVLGRILTLFLIFLPLPRRRSGRGGGEGGLVWQNRRGRGQKAPPLPGPLLHSMEERESARYEFKNSVKMHLRPSPHSFVMGRGRMIVLKHLSHLSRGLRFEITMRPAICAWRVDLP